MKRHLFKAVQYLALAVVTVALFVWAKESAFAARGYKAHGGEYLILLLPLLWWIAETTVRDFAREIKNMREESSLED